MNLKNFLIAAIFAACGASSALAVSPITEAVSVRSPEPATKITVIKSSVTTQGISISSAGATSVIVDTTQMYSQVCVQNFDTSALLACSENVNVSTQTASAVVGTIIPPAASASSPSAPSCFSILPGMNYYCRSGSGSASTRAGITRVR